MGDLIWATDMVSIEPFCMGFVDAGYQNYCRQTQGSPTFPSLLLRLSMQHIFDRQRLIIG